MSEDSDRALVSKALDVTDALVEEQWRDDVELPSWLVFDSEGRELVRNLAPLDGAMPDAIIVEALIAGCGAAAARTMSLVRVDDGDPRILAWTLNSGAKAVSRSVVREGQIIDWRRGWVDDFDDSPRGQSGATMLRYRRQRRDLQDLAAGVAVIFVEQVLPEHTRAEDVPGLIGFHDDLEEVIASAVELDLADIENGLPELLRQMRLGVAATDPQVAVHIFRWKTLGQGRHQFVISGFDIGQDNALATLAIVQEDEGRLELTESHAVEPDLLREWLEVPVDEDE